MAHIDTASDEVGIELPTQVDGKLFGAIEVRNRNRLTSSFISTTSALGLWIAVSPRGSVMLMPSSVNLNTFGAATHVKARG